MDSNFLNSHEWAENIPAPFDTTKFQAELDKAFGVDSDGGKRVRIVWGQDMSKARKYNTYDREWVHKYQWGVIAGEWDEATPSGVIARHYKSIGIPRFFIEYRAVRNIEKVTNIQAGHDEQGYYHDAFIAPERDEYRPIFLQGLCQHTPARTIHGAHLCCASRPDVTCFGDYREPDDTDLRVLKHRLQIAAQQWKNFDGEDNTGLITELSTASKKALPERPRVGGLIA